MAASHGKTRTEEEPFGKYGHFYQVVPNKKIDKYILDGEDFYYRMQAQFSQR